MVATELSAAYFDESRLGDAYPVVAGLWSDTEAWIACEQDMREALKEKPKGLAPKKYVRGNPLRFAKILAIHTALPVYATVEREYFQDIWAQRGFGENRFSTAYCQCSYCCCAMLDKHAQGLYKFQGPIKIVFDDGTEGKIYWERAYRSHHVENPSSLLSQTPLFQLDEETPPLLGADLHAWLLARKYNSVLNEEESEALRLLQTRQPLFVELTFEALQKNLGITLLRAPVDPKP
jgi:hypothetical protein